MCWTQCRYGHIRLLVIFLQFIFGIYSSELSEWVLLLILVDVQLFIAIDFSRKGPKCCNDVYTNRVFFASFRILNYLSAEYFTLTCILNSFKITMQLATAFFIASLPNFLLFFLLIFATPCFLVTEQLSMDWIHFVKRTPQRNILELQVHVQLYQTVRNVLTKLNMYSKSLITGMV